MNWTEFFLKEYGEPPKKKDKKAKEKPRANINKIMMEQIEKEGVIDKDAHIKTEPKSTYVHPKNLSINKAIDLHMDTKEKALEKLQLFFDLAVKKGWRKVLIIHGKGKHSKTGAVLGKVVWKFLEACPNAGQHGYEDNLGGGKGATWVMIKREKK